MLTQLRKWFTRSAKWFQLSHAPPGFFGPERPGAVQSAEVALTLSAFWCGVRLYQTTLGSLPLVTYRRGPNDSREVASNHPAYDVLDTRPNPAMSRNVLFEEVARAIICDGEFFAHVRKDGAGNVLGIYPIPASAVLDVAIDDEWNKAYLVQLEHGQEVFLDRELIHLFWFSVGGVRGIPLLKYAGESLGLHRQVLESATAFYRNAVRPSGYLKYAGRLDKDAVEVIKKWFKDEYAGTENTGKLPVTHDGGEFVRFPSANAEEAKIIEALGASVDDIARWLNVSPLLLFNLTRGTYSNLSADNQAFYQRTLRPLLGKIEQELNWKVFGRGSDHYAEFLTEAILRGDPMTQATVANVGIQNGTITRNEQRGWLNLPKLSGLDVPLYPQNMAPAPTEDEPTDANGTDPNAITSD